MSKFKTLLVSLLSTITLLSVTDKVVMAQATATGSVVIFNPTTGYTQSVSGQITLPAGAFVGPLTVTPTLTNSIDPNTSLPNPIIAPITDLTINPTLIDFSIPPVSLNAQTAQLLESTGNLSDQVSIIRANSNLMSNGSSSQAIATGQTTLTYPDGSVQSVSGEISLPNGLYFIGALSPTDANCGPNSGCLVIYTIDPDRRNDPSNPNLLEFGRIPQNLTVPRLETLVIDPGSAELVRPNYDLNAAAAQVLSALDPTTQLSDIVSIIRAGIGSNGPYSSQVQARAMGMAMIATPNGTTQAVSGEITLPAGLYFGDPQSLNAYCKGSGCLTVLPDIQWYGNDSDPFWNPNAQPNLSLTPTSNQAIIRQLTLNPGFVLPGDPTSIIPNSLATSSLDFNAAVAEVLYEYIDQNTLTDDQLSNIVSVIRAGAGSNGLSPQNRPVARASGSVTISLPNGATQSVSAELSLPNSLYYQGANPLNIFNLNASSNCTGGSACFAITPDFGGSLYSTLQLSDPNLVIISSLVIDAGSPNDPSIFRSWDFDAAAADALIKANALQEQVSIIRAGAGSGLE